jgi:hypothetical protein
MEYKSTTELQMTEELTRSMTKGTKSGCVDCYMCKAVLATFRSTGGSKSTTRRIFFCALSLMFWLRKASYRVGTPLQLPEMFQRKLEHMPDLLGQK